MEQILNQGGKQVDRIAPKIIKGAMGDMCKTPFRLLGQFGKKKLAQVERKVTRIFKKWYVFIEKGMAQENLFISNMEKKYLVPTANPCWKITSRKKYSPEPDAQTRMCAEKISQEYGQ